MIRAIMNNIRLLQQKLKMDISFGPDSQTIQDQSSQGQRQTLSCQYFNFVLFFFFCVERHGSVPPMFVSLLFIVVFQDLHRDRNMSAFARNRSRDIKSFSWHGAIQNSKQTFIIKNSEGGIQSQSQRERDRQEEGKQQVTVLSLLAAVSCSFAAPVFHVRLYMRIYVLLFGLFGRILHGRKTR